jgi:hypothetical protein
VTETGRGKGSRRAERRAELSEALEAVRGRIGKACVAAGRRPEDVQLVAVTKTRPASDVALLLDLGHDAFGENRPQEAAAKVAELSELCPGNRASWYMIGRLQRNKVRSVAGWAARVESVDSARLADALDRAALRAMDRGERAGPLPVLLQVSLDADPARGGAPVGELPALADRVAASEGLELHGLMAVAPLGVDPDRAFAALAEEKYRMGIYHSRARVMSAGMTADFEAAIRHGSTCVRVGTALLGDRPLTSP